MNIIKRNKVNALRNFTIITFFALLTANNANAKQRQDVKCYVELYGGAETVIFIETYGNQAKNLDKVAKQWVNKKVQTQVAKDKKVIYKVHECALLNTPFKTSKARAIDYQTAR